MEATRLQINGDGVDQFVDAFVESKATASERSLNKRGVRNVTRYDGGGDDGGFTLVSYERGAVYDESWVTVTVLVETLDAQTATVVLLVGGGGQGPFKFEEFSARRIVKGEESVGQAGRFGTVLSDIEDICATLEVDVTTEWESDTESSMATKVAHELFEV
jgi:hypothetical protein